MTAGLEINEDSLRLLVAQFYARIRQDAELGPIFNGAVRDWPEHLEKLTDFWSSVMLTTGRYKGRPVPAHVKHAPGITPQLFQRWLKIWAGTTNDLMAPDAAQALQVKAARIAESLQLALFFKLPERQPSI